jgi:hypothetical protein
MRFMIFKNYYDVWCMSIIVFDGVTEWWETFRI